MKLDRRDVKLQAFKGRGPGGQHKNKTMTCVRATHGPTGITVVASSERSLHANIEAALKTLAGRLAKLAEERLQAERKARRDDKPEAAFGSQIRTYRVCGSEQGVKDHRTGVETSIDALTRGRIDPFLVAFLKGGW
jgi:protein subunit release factor B